MIYELGIACVYFHLRQVEVASVWKQQGGSYLFWIHTDFYSFFHYLHNIYIWRKTINKFLTRQTLCVKNHLRLTQNFRDKLCLLKIQWDSLKYLRDKLSVKVISLRSYLHHSYCTTDWENWYGFVDYLISVEHLRMTIVDLKVSKHLGHWKKQISGYKNNTNSKSTQKYFITRVLQY